MSISKTAFIHPTAIVENGAILEDDVHVGPYSCVGPNVILKKGVRIESHAVISGDTVIGEGSHIYPFAAIGLEPQDLKYNKERSRLEIGKNTTIREYVTASIGTTGGGMVTKIGDNCLVMAYCHIAHDCIIGNNVIMVNGVNLAGHVVVDDNAIIGGMSAVKQFSRIGKNAMVGGATGIEKDVIPYGVVVTERPTSVKGINVIGLKRRGFKAEYIQEILAAFNEIFEESDKQTMAERAKTAAEKYSNNEAVQEIVEFILNNSKNNICTTKP